MKSDNQAHTNAYSNCSREIFNDLKRSAFQSQTHFNLIWNGLTLIQQQRMTRFYSMFFELASQNRSCNHDIGV